jgi:tRNA pseudouridine38-40 synthase
MRNIKLTIEYDGTNYLGWQIQPNGETIQRVIEDTLKKITSEDVHLIGSGRTDSGVHALGQVANFKTNSHIDIISLQRALNSLLPSDIVIKKVEEVDLEFNSRKNAKSKVYEYRIFNQEIPSVFLRSYAWHIPQRLNWIEIKKATEILIGEHDFSSFRSAGSSIKNSIRKVFSAEWRIEREGLVFFEIEANGFLKQMVRTIVGTLIEVGKEKIDSQEFKKILVSKDRRKAGPTAPAHGLYLKEVKY